MYTRSTMKTFASLAAILSCFVAPAAADLKGVFAHYLVGTITSDHAATDVKLAKSIGIDAFALNVQDAVDSWATDAISTLFAAASANDFKLFFSLDMAAQSQASYFIPLIEQYHSNSAYYTHNNLPFVSTFYGATLTFGSDTPNDGWQSQLRNALSFPIYFVPAFSDAPNGPTNFFSTYPVVDGVMSWDSAWPYATDGNINVTDSADQQYLSGARSADKTFMMALSAVQFKHIDSSQNWYRKGELNMALRIGQVLSLAPDFLEILTWNDGGESHNIGSCWDESISGSAIQGYSDGYDHSGWQKLVPPVVKAFKASTTDLTTLTPATGTVSGAFWYRPLLTTASCSGDSLGKPSNWQSAQDVINIALFFAEAGNVVTVYSGNNQIASYATKKGLNSFQVPGLVAGPVSVNVWTSSGSLVTDGASTQDVVGDTSGVCNFNYQTVSISA